MTQPDQSAEITFKAIFESIPISIWVEDFSAVVAALDTLRDQGVVDIGSYLRDHPGETERLVQLIRVLDINNASLGLYGAESKEELFSSLDMLFTPQALVAFRDELVAIAENRPGFTAEVESKKLRGERIDLLISVVPATPGGGWGRALVTATDITERKQLEGELRESRTSFAAIVDRNTDGITVVDADRVVRFANPAACALLETPLEQLVGSRFDRASHLSAGNEIEVRRSDGTPGVAELRSIETTWDGQPAHLVVLRDVTERKRLEKDLLQAQKMEAIGRLAGGVAHEFNNLLQAMLSTAEAGLAGDAGGAGIELLRELEPLILRGRSQTRQLLLFSRREEPHLEPLELNWVLRENMAMLERLVAENIVLEMELGERDLQVRGDAGQLGQVLVNLVVNAADALPDGGKITVRSGMRPGGGPSTEPTVKGKTREQQPGQVWFEVEDSGSGIPEHVRDRIFEPFFTTKERGLGTGLGLSVAHGIVSRHRGNIEVESRENLGTRVLVLLPEERGGSIATAAGQESTSGIVPGRGERVLLVEDEPAARSGLFDVLEMLGYATVAVENAEQALALSPIPAFDVLVTDLMLPGLSGGALAERLLVRWPDLGIIIISGYSEDRTADLVHNLESARFMHKPFRMAELSHEIRAALDAR
jgi:signal transduction histidine kinase